MASTNCTASTTTTRGKCKTWTMDYGLDWTLDRILDSIAHVHLFVSSLIATVDQLEQYTHTQTTIYRYAHAQRGIIMIIIHEQISVTKTIITHVN